MRIENLITFVFLVFCCATFAGDDKSLLKYYENRNPRRDAELAIKNNNLKFVALMGIAV